MKKIIIASDGSTFPSQAFSFAVELNQLSPILLVGVFLPEVVYPGDYGFTGEGVFEMPSIIPFLEVDKAKLKHNIEQFKTLCEKSGVEYRVHEGTDSFALPQLEKESRFADALFVDSNTFSNYDGDKSPDDYLKILLRHAECPVVVLPKEFSFPDKIVLAYDGSDSSVYAIKQFTYIFPELSDRSTLLIYAEKGEEPTIPDSILIEELAPRHFSDFSIFALEKDADFSFDEWMNRQESPLLVTGAYDRSALSEFFKKSFAENMLGSSRFPIFITHR